MTLARDWNYFLCSSMHRSLGDATRDQRAGKSFPVLADLACHSRRGLFQTLACRLNYEFATLRLEKVFQSTTGWSGNSLVNIGLAGK